MVIYRDDLTSLGAKPRLVGCPACTAFAKTVLIQDSLSPRSKTSIGLKAVFSLGLSLLWSRDKPRCAWFAHYCGNCGLRLVLCDEHGNRNYVESSQLITSRSKDGVTRRIAPSPYAASSLVLKDVPSVAARYRHLRPKSVFSVQFEGNTGVPSKIVRTGASGETYKIDCPDLDWNRKFHIDYVIPKRPRKHGLIKTIWSHRRPSIKVLSSLGADKGRVAGLVQLSQQRWDVKLYFPRDVLDQDTAPEYEARMIEAHDEYIFAPELPHVLWKSSEGHLLWTSRFAKDGTGSGDAIEKRMVLVDSYDRLVAMEISSEPQSARAKYFKTTDRPRAPSLSRRLYMYGNLTQNMVNEVVTAYVAVLAQMFRKARKDYELLMETQNL
ncbi:hypothetical protein V2A60_008884 [Cordyceps javanica]|uniref:Uncharacterized protein n=1 Tax=Cordyceps javanica TaxID=43265 RepID=A0A545UPS9_9HYPO|nr:hypothetical protein IF1G_09969 [Cordyceps javanica]TQW03115.1 hypothetical protein IF2G_09248 [Cordyceps javanica]